MGDAVPPGRAPSAGRNDTNGGPARVLGPIVEQEARRVLSEAQLAPDPARIADGWERRFVADGQRVEEMMALYRQLGFEVCADPVRPELLTGDCEDCKLLMLPDSKTIYTRRPR
jgi:hypothetical protein